MSAEHQTVEISRHVRILDQLVIGLAEKHGLQNPQGDNPERLLDPHYITEATSYYHTIEQLENIPPVVPPFNILIKDSEKLSAIQNPVDRFKAISTYVNTGELPLNLHL